MGWIARGLASLTLAAGLWFGAVAQAKVFEPSRFVLDNGLELVVIQDSRRPAVAHMIYYRVGSMDEAPGKTGLAHYLEHLMFKGTDSVGDGEFSRFVSRHGGRDNAFTSRDMTAYFQIIAADKLADVMAMEADRMINLKFEEDVAKSELAVVLEERLSRIEGRPGGVLSETLAASLYLAHPYRNPIIGWRLEIEGLTRDDVFAFYKRWYMPNNAIVVIAGDVEPEAALALAKDTYGKVPAGDLPDRRTYFEPEQTAPRKIVYADARVRQPNWRRLYLAPAFEGAAVAPYALTVLSEIFGGETGRLHKALVLEGKQALQTSFWYDGRGRDFGSAGLYGVPADGVELADLEAAMDAAVADLLKTGVTEAEVADAKRRLIADAVFARDSLSGPARILGGALANGQTVEDVELWPARIQAVTKADVDAAAKTLLRIERSATGWLLPKTEDPS